MAITLRLSVHNLVDFLLRSGDIDDRIFNRSTMAEGTRLHTLYQTNQIGNYLSEYYLEETFKVDRFDVVLNGRADGIILIGNSIVVDEIKTTIVDLEEFFNNEKEWHLGQAKCYALMIAHEKHAEEVKIKLTYIHQITNEKVIHDFTFKTKDLEKEVNDLIYEYISFYNLVEDHQLRRNEILKDATFPYKDYRKGQRDLSRYSYGIALNGGLLFAEAPTGIGKTMSTLFPFVKSFSSTDNEKIFYLTAKNPGKEAAINAVMTINETNDNVVSAISITARDKICPNPDKGCNPDECVFAKAYYKKVNEVLKKALSKKNQLFTSKEILKLANKYEICPFEFELDLSLYLDVIICDYNYFFDPQVYFKRYFDESSSNYLALIDEAHNLVERGRNMYSSVISSESLTKAKECIKYLDHKKIKSTSRKLTKLFNEFKDYPDGETLLQDGLDVSFLNAVENYLLASLDVMKNLHEFINEDFKDFHFELNKFMKLMDFYDHNFAIYLSKDKYETKINLFCLNPADNLRSSLNKIKGAVIFSATLSPINYYMNMICGEDTKPFLSLKSPFKKNNLLLMVSPNISTRYKRRNETINQVKDLIEGVITSKIGNYFVYVPSYEYLNNLVPLLEDLDIDLLIQEKNMTNEEKEQFISIFQSNPTRSRVGIAVIGGAFSEGIDLIEDRLIGVIVVGVGLPQLCFERDLIRNYFDSIDPEFKEGYNYSYLYPGMNKVFQAAGRVIRSENDRGVVLLIDDRYLNSNYRKLYPESWSHYEVVNNRDDVEVLMKEFYKEELN